MNVHVTENDETTEKSNSDLNELYTANLIVNTHSIYNRMRKSKIIGIVSKMLDASEIVEYWEIAYNNNRSIEWELALNTDLLYKGRKLGRTDIKFQN